ncbi:alpha/beta hydrolase [Thermaurantiacus tibetensis]|uniref:alpha/beta fold hydrolase n=1 Tax=Thermaurantiacus tibetensis TaxID=2759035 RepID=UPI002E2AABAA|nr:alpha/beta hydrolase [Thermaurantiacus tibetensis]
MRKLLAGLAVVAGLLVAAFLAVRTPDIPAEVLRARYANAASQFLDLAPGFAVHVRDEGPRDAPVLLLLHGSNASLHTWEPWVERLGQDYRVVTLDLQGHGLTGPIPSGCYTGSCMAETVERVRARLGIERMAVGGNSMGGLVAIRYALAHPERVSALILVDSAGAQFRNGGSRPLGFRIAAMPGARTLAEQITPRAMIARSLDQSTSVKAAATPEKVDRYWELLRHPGNRAATIARFAAPREPFGAETLKPLAGLPVLILWGREDRLFPPEAAAWFKAALPEAELVILDGVGHIPQEEAPDASAEAVRAFLERHAPTPARIRALQSPA